MLTNLGRTRAWLVALGLMLGLSLAFAAASGPATGPEQTGPGFYPDTWLYRDVAARVAAGEGYYSAATTLQRAHGFPTRPFVTVRLPLLAELSARLGPAGTQLALAGVILAAALALAAVFIDQFSLAEGAGAALAVLIGGAQVANRLVAGEHEAWGGALLTLALAFWIGRRWVPALLVAGLALAIRELALPFVALAGLVAVAERRALQATGWAAAAGLFAILLVWHARAVATQVHPGDLASQGWSGLRGPGAALRDLLDVSLVHVLPARLAAMLAVLPVVGWLAAPARVAGFALALAGAYFAALALFARDQNLYWAMMLLPWWFAGLALVPRGVRQLARAIAG